MSDIIDRTLIFAKREDKPVIIVYDGKKGISQRRVYIRDVYKRQLQDRKKKLSFDF